VLLTLCSALGEELGALLTLDCELGESFTLGTVLGDEQRCSRGHDRHLVVGESRTRCPADDLGQLSERQGLDRFDQRLPRRRDYSER
jgi:hypothetical protein